MGSVIGSVAENGKRRVQGKREAGRAAASPLKRKAEN
jgi:hypothetical protein